MQIPRVPRWMPSLLLCASVLGCDPWSEDRKAEEPSPETPPPAAAPVVVVKDTFVPPKVEPMALTAEQKKALVDRCEALQKGPTAPLELHVDLINMADVIVPQTVTTTEAECRGSATTDETGQPSIGFWLDYLRPVDGGDDPVLVKEQIFVDLQSSTASMLDTGGCEFNTINSLHQAARDAGIDVGLYLEQYQRVAFTNCYVVREKLRACLVAGGTGC